MCGIAGIVSSTKCSNISEKIIKNMLTSMRNRGPDCSSHIRTEKGIFLHSRLKIQDLHEHANQPWTCGKWILIFNGEIYNFREIRKSLKTFTFHTDCDTEVLMNLFLHHECDITKTLKDINGMFAFAFYNKETHNMIIARDRLGIKPLFYHYNDYTFVFGSNINCLLQSQIFQPLLLNRSLSFYLSFRAPLYTDTMFSNIMQLAPGHFMEINLSDSVPINISEYWDIPVSTPTVEQKIDVRTLVQDCVQRRMVADVPLCTYLSGGVDSSAITAFTQMASTNKINSYTIGFPELNEFQYARIVSELYKTQHSEQTVDYSTYFQTMVDLIYEKGEPLGVPNEVPLFLMSKKLKQDGFTVVLSGEGADEIFQGYGRIFQLGHDYERLLRFEKGDTSYANFKEFYKNADTSTFCKFFINRYSYVSLEEKINLLKGETSNMHINSLFNHFFSKVEHLDLGNQISYAMLKLHLPTLLRRFDNSTMATSVEGRVPFVDHTLIEKVFKIPSNKKIPWKTTEDDADKLLSNKFSEIHDIPKAILKDALRDDLPSEILYRRKMGFPVPLRDWFAGHFNEQIKFILYRLAGRNIFKCEKVIQIADQFNSNSSNSDTYLIWGLLNIEIWYSLFIDNKTPIDIKSDIL